MRFDRQVILIGKIEVFRKGSVPFTQTDPTIAGEANLPGIKCRLGRENHC